MSRSKMLYQLQQMDSALDKSQKRILEIDALIKDHHELDQAVQIKNQSEQILREKQKSQQQAEEQVDGQNQKIDQNQKKLYSGIVTNPKELEDLQLEYNSLNNYLSVLEERQLETMLETEQAQAVLDKKSLIVKVISERKQISDEALNEEKEALEQSIKTISKEKDNFLKAATIPDLPDYLSLRKSLGGFAVTLMISSSCSSCGANIPSAIEQQARSPVNLAHCPSCRRILHPG